MTFVNRGLAVAVLLAGGAGLVQPAAAQSYSASPTPAAAQYPAAQYPAAQYPAPAASAPLAAPPPPPPAPAPVLPFANIIDEFKTGVVVHDIGFLGHHVEHGEDVNLEVLFKSPDFLRIIGSPRPHIGGDINTDGNTSDGYFGLTWGLTLVPDLFGTGGSLFGNGSLGGAVHDGYLDSAPPGRKRLGSPILFRESLELGYQATPVVSVSLFIEHISNANLAKRNAGITSAGMRLGFKF